MSRPSSTAIHLILLGVSLAGSVILSTACGQSPQAQGRDAVPAGKPKAALTPYRNQPDRIANREAAYYGAVWGIAAPNIKAVESGVLLRFSYRVLDPEKARPLSDKSVNPVLESPEKGVRLVIPSMEKVGQLRQAPRDRSRQVLLDGVLE